MSASTKLYLSDIFLVTRERYVNNTMIIYRRSLISIHNIEIWIVIRLDDPRFFPGPRQSVSNLIKYLVITPIRGKKYDAYAV